MICNQVPLFVDSSFTDAKDKLCVLYAGGNATWLFCNLGKCHFWPICSIDVRHLVSLLTLFQVFVPFVLLFQIFPILFHLIQWATISLKRGKTEVRTGSGCKPIYLNPPISPLFEWNTAQTTIFISIFIFIFILQSPLVWVKYGLQYNLRKDAPPLLPN